jgi:hypothetical protein
VIDDAMSFSCSDHRNNKMMMMMKKSTMEHTRTHIQEREHKSAAN